MKLRTSKSYHHGTNANQFSASVVNFWKIRFVQQKSCQRKPLLTIKTLKRSTLLNTKVSCHHCSSSEHFLGYCPTFLLLSANERFEFVKRESLCVNCLRKGNYVSKCSSKCRCRNCGATHQTTLHFDQSRNAAYTTKLSATSHTHRVSTTHVANASCNSFLTYTTKRAFIPPRWF